MTLSEVSVITFIGNSEKSSGFAYISRAGEGRNSTFYVTRARKPSSFLATWTKSRLAYVVYVTIMVPISVAMLIDTIVVLLYLVWMLVMIRLVLIRFIGLATFDFTGLQLVI